MNAFARFLSASLVHSSHLRSILRGTVGLLIGLLLAGAPAAAQTGTVKGTVTDAETGEPLPGANVVLQDTDKGTATESNGQFVLKEIASGEYTLRASLVGYKTVTRDVTVKDRSTTQVNLKMAQKAVELEGLTVTGQQDGYKTDQNITATRVATPNLETPMSVQAVPQQVIADQEATTLREVTRNVSGIQRASTFGGALQRFRIRGFRQDIMLKDGFRTGGSTTKVFAETAHLDRVEVLKGPASILYGRLEPGGIINLVRKQPTAEPQYKAKLRGGQFGLIEPSVDVSGPINDSGTLKYRFNGLYRREDGFRESFNQDYERFFAAPVLSWQINDRTNLTLQGTLPRRTSSRPATRSNIGSAST